MPTKHPKTIRGHLVDTTSKYYRIRQRSPHQFTRFRTPAWGSRVASSITKGSKLVTGKVRGKDEWRIQTILIPKRGKTASKAVSLASRIRKKVEKK